MSGINTNLNPVQSLTSIGFRGISSFSGTPTPPEVRTYATWNPADKDAGVVLLNGNLTAESTDYVNWHAVRSTISKSSGKWYWEITQTAGFAGGNITQGVAKSTENLASFVGNGANGYGLFGDTQKINNSSFSAYGTLGRNIIVGDIVQVLLNMDSGNVSFGVNGTTYGIAFSGLSGEFFAIVANAYSTQTANFGATPFAYPVPSGYNAGLYDTVDLTAGLVAHYPLATNSLDTSGNEYNGTVNGTVTFNGTDATFGSGWVSNGVQITADGTHSIWFKTSDASTRMALISKFSGANGQRIYVGDANKLQVAIGGPYTELIGGVAVNDGVYHNAVYTWGTGGIKLYIDNVLIASNAATHSNNGGTTMNIGYNEAEWPFVGQLKKARIYNRVLNAGEIAALYAEVQPEYFAPTSVSWQNGGGYVPDIQGSLNSGMILRGNNSFTGCTGMSIISTVGGVITVPTIDGSGRLVFNYTTPFTDPDTLVITGFNAIGGAISISFRVDLPF